MATTVTYKGSTLTSATNQTKVLKTAGKYMEDDVTITDVSSGGSAIVVTEETDAGGGIIKHITAVDLSNDTVSSATLLSGYTAHDFQGNAIVGTYSGGGITPTGTISITANGTYDVTAYASASVSVAGQTVNNQNKTVSASTVQTTVTYDNGYTGLGTVTINAIPTGTAGTPSATKSAVSNNQITITPSVTNTTGYITGETKTGTAVTVSASELVSGTLTITSAGSKDVTNYASASVAAGIVTAPTTITSTGATLTTGTNTLTLSKSVSVTPNVTTAGYISQGTAGNATVTLTASVTTKGAATYTPSSTNQTIASNQYLTGVQTISGDSNLVGSNILSGKSIFGVSGTVTFQTYYTGTSTPSAALGSNGDIYLQS